LVINATVFPKEQIMTIVVTGATGSLGRGVVAALLDRGVPAERILATGRNADRLAELDVPTREASFDDPASLRAALTGADRVLLVSGNEIGRRVPQHRNVIDAAREAGVERIVYTSAPKADTSDMRLVDEHRVTEELLRESGVPAVVLRNGWYVENYDVADALEHGMFGASGEGRVSVAPRSDYAEAAAAALLLDSPKPVYELGGESFTLAELAAAISRHAGREVTYTDLGDDEYLKHLLDAGLPAPTAEIFVDVHRATRHGALEVEGDDLATLLGRPPTPLAVALAR
jgi:NAD(P)H dehydrogenase (quinone)